MGKAAEKRAEAGRLMAQSLVWEGSVGWTPECLPYSDGVLDRYRQAGFHHLSLTIAAEWNGIEAAMRHLARVRRFFLSRPSEFALVRSVDDIAAARAEGRLAISFNFQGGGPFGGEPAMAAIYAALGVRLAILSYNGRNAFGDGCQEPGNAGLSRQGLAMVDALNKAGIVIDLSHVGERTARETIEASRHPVVFSHSNPAALYRHVRNISDDLIRACAARGGVIGMNSLGFMLDAENRSKAAKFVDHVRHVADLVGRGHVALGMDWNFYDPFMQQMFRENPGMAALGYPPPPWDSLPPDRLPRIVERLLEAGWSDADMGGLLGQNMMRIARQVWPGG
jgi:membrane dipeptidase